jgi:hypothetical protein
MITRGVHARSSERRPPGTTARRGLPGHSEAISSGPRRQKESGRRVGVTAAAITLPLTTSHEQHEASNVGNIFVLIRDNRSNDPRVLPT